MEKKTKSTTHARGIKREPKGTPKYVTAGKYFDSTMTNLKPRSREFKLIKKKRENLADVIKYEEIAQRDDSILKIALMSDVENQIISSRFVKEIVRLKGDIKKFTTKSTIKSLKEKYE